MDGFLCGASSYDDLACWAGNIAAVSFFIVQVPQILLNYRRRSTTGFSSLSVIIRVIGGSFMVSIGFVRHISFPLLFAGILNLLENLVFTIQFALYRQNKWYYLGFAIPVPAVLLTTLVPSSIKFTRWINPATQVICYLPYIWVIIESGTTKGISLLGQHLNMFGGVLGMLMCAISCRCDEIGWLYYLFSLIQAGSVFMIAMSFGEFRIVDPDSPPMRSETVAMSRRNTARQLPEDGEPGEELETIMPE